MRPLHTRSAAITRTLWITRSVAERWSGRRETVNGGAGCFCCGILKRWNGLLSSIRDEIKSYVKTYGRGRFHDKARLDARRGDIAPEKRRIIINYIRNRLRYRASVYAVYTRRSRGYYATWKGKYVGRISRRIATTSEAFRSSKMISEQRENLSFETLSESATEELIQSLLLTNSYWVGIFRYIWFVIILLMFFWDSVVGLGCYNNKFPVILSTIVSLRAVPTLTAKIGTFDTF